jgi:DNA-directed RNA polymerase subunit RPC12/RpoP
VVFTVPHELNVLALNNPPEFYELLFRASAAAALELAADRKHLGAEIGIVSILHTWGQNLLLHPHLHGVIPSGGLSADHGSWVRPRYPFFLPVKALSRVFRGKFVAGLKRLYRPKGFVRIRHVGFLANRWRTARLAICRGLLGCHASSAQVEAITIQETSSWQCPNCGARMLVQQRFTAAELSSRSAFFDSS